jgi:hypothetical protein
VSRPARRLLAALVLVLVVPLVSVLGPSGPAAALAPDAASPAAARADTEPGSDVQYFTKNVGAAKTVWVKQFNVCLLVGFTGTMKARYFYRNKAKYLNRPQLTSSRVAVTTKKSCAVTAPVKKRNGFGTFGYYGYLYGYTCSYDPSFSVSIPWSVSVGVTPDCGNERVAKIGDRQKNTGNASYFEKTTSVDVGWDDEDRVALPGPGTKPKTELCTSVSVFITMRKTSGSRRIARDLKVALPDFCIQGK